MRNNWLVIAFVLFNLTLFAQDEEGEIKVDNFYKAKIEEASKISDNPVITDTIDVPKNVSYNVVKKHVDTDFKPNEIPAPKLSLDEKIKKLDQHFVSLGLGMNAMPGFQYEFGSNRSRTKAIHLGLNHYGFKKEVEDINNNYQNSQLNFDYKVYQRSYSWYTNVKYNYLMDHYGYAGDLNDLSHTALNYKANYADGSAYIGYRTKDKDSTAINHAGAIGYENFFNRSGEMEHFVNINANGSGYHENVFLNIGLEGSYAHHDLNSGVYNNFFFNLTPTFSITKDRLKAKLGLVASASLEKASNQGGINGFADIDFVVIKNFMMLYGDMSGGYRRNSLQYAAGINPYLMDGFVPTMAFEKWNIVAGLKGQLSKSMTYNIGISSKEVENDLLYFASGWNSIWFEFSAITDEVETRSMFFEWTHQGKKIENNLRVDLFQYATKGYHTAYNRPSQVVTWDFNYNIQDLFQIGLESSYIGTRWVENQSKEDNTSMHLQLDGFFNFNLNLAYSYTNKLEAFAKVFNVGNSNYQYWYNFPSQGANFLIGASYKF